MFSLLIGSCHAQSDTNGEVSKVGTPNACGSSAEAQHTSSTSTVGRSEKCVALTRWTVFLRLRRLRWWRRVLKNDGRFCLVRGHLKTQTLHGRWNQTEPNYCSGISKHCCEISKTATNSAETAFEISETDTHTAHGMAAIVDEHNARGTGGSAQRGTPT